MPLYEYICNCGYGYERLEFGAEIEAPHICEKCGTLMEREFSSTATFRLNYDPKKHKSSWGAEGYSSSQAHRESDKLCKKNI